ncbi:MAG TPA: nuclear transport factor 2 family protein [Chitinophagaceae bacterium]|nr:nuclear transport factor 2 family protein [Chitinophagaceae bacterium]
MKSIFFPLFFALLLSGLITSAQSKQEKAVASAVEQLKVAMVNGDRSQLESLVHDNLSYGHSSGYIDDKKEFVEKIASGKSDFVSIDLTDQTISISGKTAIVRHILIAKTNDGGKPGDVHLKVMLVWQKRSGKWILLARQAVKIA